MVPFLVEADDDGHAGWKVWLAARERCATASPRPSTTCARAHQARYDDCFGPDAVVQAALARLRGAGWNIAVVTNGPGDARRDKVPGVRPRPSTSTRAASPTSRAPASPTRGSSRSPPSGAASTLDGAWMVGDSPEADIAGAHAIGARSIWLHRGREWPGTAPCPPPTHTAATIPDAVDTLLRSSFSS